jgi:uncharacterized protein (TIGR03437 family)
MRTRPLILAAMAASAACLIAQAQSPTITGLANNATTFIPGNVIAPGEEVNIMGSNLGDATAVGCGTPTGFTTTCGGVSVMVAGKAAGVRNEGASQVVIQVPVDAPLGAGQLVLTRSSGGQNLVSRPFNVNVVAYTPELYIGAGNPTNVTFPQCYNASNVQISLTNPAAPGSTLRCLGDGFGVTNPVVPTGTITPTLLPAVVAPVTVTVAGQNATGISATLAPSSYPVGEDQVIFTLPLHLFTGNQPLVVSVGGVETIIHYQLPIAVAGPNVTSVVNGASYIPPGLPNAGIAQGGIFIVFGGGIGPANLTFAARAFQSSTVSNTSVSVTVAGTTVNALMYYTSASQLAALLPSNTPTGTGSITVTYNGQASNAAPITVVANNLGIFTIGSDGQGPGIVTYPDYSLVSANQDAQCGGPNTFCGAAKPGDTLILWATGLGPVSGDDASGAGLGKNMPDIPLTVWLGGVQAPVAYQGRSGCCVGEDQIVFTVPNNAPTGCAVPLLVQIGNQISNNTVMPVAIGSRNCTPTNPAFASVSVEQAVIAGPVSFGDISVSTDPNSSGTGYQDNAHFQFARILTYTPGTQPFFVSYVDDQPPGTCIVFNDVNEDSINTPFSSVANLDAGSSFTVMGPKGSVPVTGTPGKFNATLSAAGTFLVPGAYAITGAGGPDVGPFTAALTIPAWPTLASPLTNNLTVTRSNGMTVTWAGNGSTGNVVIQVAAATDSTYNFGANATCRAPASAGTFTIPPYALLALPAGNFGALNFVGLTPAAGFTAAGLSVGFLQASGVPTGPSGFTIR